MNEIPTFWMSVMLSTLGNSPVVPPALPPSLEASALGLTVNGAVGAWVMDGVAVGMVFQVVLPPGGVPRTRRGLLGPRFHLFHGDHFSCVRSSRRVSCFFREVNYNTVAGNEGSKTRR